MSWVREHSGEPETAGPVSVPDSALPIWMTRGQLWLCGYISFMPTAVNPSPHPPTRDALRILGKYLKNTLIFALNH